MIATGIQFSVRDFVNAATKELGMEIRWRGAGMSWMKRASTSTANASSPSIRATFCPTEVEALLGDPTKANETLGWTSKTTFDELVAEMIREGLKSAKRDDLVKAHGYKAMDHHE